MHPLLRPTVIALALAATAPAAPAGHAAQVPATPTPTRDRVAERVAELVPLLRDPSRRDEVRAELVSLGSPALTIVLSRMRDADWLLRWDLADIQDDFLDTRAVPALVFNVLHDSNRHVRWRSVLALHQNPGSREGVRLLREALGSSDGAVRWNAATGLALFKEREALALLHAGLADPDPWRRWEAITSLGLVGDPSSVAHLKPLVASSALSERSEAVMSLGSIGGPEAVATLVSALADPVADIRLRVVQNLGSMGGAEGRVALLARQAQEPEPEVRAAIVEALAREPLAPAALPTRAPRPSPLAGPSPSPASSPGTLEARVQGLVAALGEEGRAGDVRAELLRLGPQALPLLIAELTHPAFAVRWQLVDHFGEIADPRVVEPLVQRVLHDEEPHVRWRSVWALTRNRDRRAAIASLRDGLRSSDDGVRWNAAIALSAFDLGDGLSLIHQALSHADSWRRWEAINALQRVHDASSAAALLPMLRSTEVSERSEAVLSLRAIGGAEAIAGIRAALADPAPEVRWRAVQALAAIGGPAGHSAIAELREREREPIVLDAISAALGTPRVTPPRTPAPSPAPARR